MKNKIMPLMISGVLISFSALSQTTEKSSHPKLDALFPHSKNTTATSNIPDSTKPSPTNIVTDKSAITSGKITNTTSTPATNIVTDNNTISSEKIPGNNTSTPVTDVATDSNIKPAGTVTYQTAPQQEVPARSAQKGIYNDNRLGSSTEQYNTYEKNDNGAGAVTTRPK